MLSKEEIEFNLKVTSNVMLNFEDELCDKMQERIKEIKEYINQLETDKQKLIEKLKEDNKRNKKAVIYYEQARRDCKDESEYKKIYQNNINTLNAKREVRKEILKILKGEKEWH